MEDALGAPWAAWEVVAPWAALARVEGPAGGPKVTEYALALSTTRAAEPAAAAPPKGLRAWRSGAVVTEARRSGARVDDATGALTLIDLHGQVHGDARDGRNVAGTIEVHGALSDAGRVPTVARPSSEDLALRQRLVPEQRELLAGLPVTHPLPVPPPKPGAHPPAAAAAAKAPAAAPKGPAR